MPSREYDRIINGRLVIARPRRTEIEVDVYSGTEKDPDQLIGEWGMPKQIGIPLAMETAERQTGNGETDMPAAREYQFNQRSGGRGAVIRIGPTGGKRVVQVYQDQDAAWELMQVLNKLKDREA